MLQNVTSYSVELIYKLFLETWTVENGINFSFISSTSSKGVNTVLMAKTIDDSY